MTRDQAIRKVLACLRLAASSNPSEAATALRQARALMDKFGLTEADAAAAEIADVDAPTGFRGGDVPRSLLALANLVADGYRCAIVLSRMVGHKTTVRFFGGGADAQIAAYAFTVLRRQLRAAKADHTSRIRKRANKERRGEEFALGWIIAVARLFPKETLTAGRAAAIAAAISSRCGQTSKTAGKEVGKHGRASEADRWAGYQAGLDAQLNQGLAGAEHRKLEALG